MTRGLARAAHGGPPGRAQAVATASAAAAAPAAAGAIPPEWGPAVEELIRTVGAVDGPPLLVLDGMSAAGRRDILTLARPGWERRGLTILSGQAPLAAGGLATGALYDALIRSPRWLTSQESDDGRNPAEATGGTYGGTTLGGLSKASCSPQEWASHLRLGAGPRPFVLLLHDVDLWPEDNRRVLHQVADALAADTPRGSIVINPIAPVRLPEEMAATLTCPNSIAELRLGYDNGGENRIHPELARALERITGDRRLMLAILGVWRRRGQIRRVDGLWMPGEELHPPPLQLSHPGLGVLRTLSLQQQTVLAVVSLLGPVTTSTLEAALAWGGAGQVPESIEDCLRVLHTRGVIESRGREQFVVDGVLRISVAASVGAAQAARWRERAGLLPAVGGPLPAVGGLLPAVGGLLPAVGGLLPAGGLLSKASGSARREATPLVGRLGDPLGRLGELSASHLPDDGECAIDAARWAVVQPDGAGEQLSRAAGLAAVVLSRRGRLDRARAWLELAGGSAERGVWHAWGKAEIRRVEGRYAAAEAAFDEALALAGAVRDQPTSASSDACGQELEALIAAERSCFAADVNPEAEPASMVTGAQAMDPERDFLSATRAMRAALRAIRAGDAPSERVRDVLTVARRRRCVLVWCEAAQFARDNGLSTGKAPVGAEDGDDVQRALLSLMAAGQTTRECASVLSMRVRAVEYRIKALFELTGCSSRAELIREYVHGRVLDPSL